MMRRLSAATKLRRDDLRRRFDGLMGPTAKRVGPVRHFGGLAAAGLIALAVDLGVLWALIGVGVPALGARVVSIAVAMVVSWLINRTISFAVKTPPNLTEFGRFAAVSWGAQAVNYAVFSISLLLMPTLSPTIAVLLGCAVSIFVAYAGFRFAVFRGPNAG